MRFGAKGSECPFEVASPVVVEVLPVTVQEPQVLAPVASLQAVTPQLVAAAGRTIGGWGRASGSAMGASGQVTVGSDYDPAGRLVEKRVGDYVWSFGYDTEGRLKTATQDWQPVPWEAAERSTEVAYGHDAFGRRVRLEQTDWAARIEAGRNWTQSRTADLTYRFVYDGPNVVAEYVDEDGDTVVDRKRIYWNEPSIDQKIGFVDLDGDGNATVYYYVTDQVGSVLQVLDATGKLVEQYAYDAFGNLREGKCTLKSGFDNRYRFHGRELDPFTGQYYYRYRQYDPDLGRFTNPDHQVDLADRFGPCNYAFCQNNPLVYADPMGLWRVQLFGEDYQFGEGTDTVLVVDRDTGTDVVDAAAGVSDGLTFGLYNKVVGYEVQDQQVYAGGKVGGKIAQGALIGAATAGLGQAAAAGQGGIWTLRAAQAVTVLDTAQAGYAVGHGGYEVSQGNHYGWAEMAGGILGLVGAGSSARDLGKAGSAALNATEATTGAVADAATVGGKAAGQLDEAAGAADGMAKAAGARAVQSGAITDPRRLLTSGDGPLADHHVFPLQHRGFFENAGISNIDDFTVTVDQQVTHLKAIHGRGNMGQMPGKWNPTWAEWINHNPTATAKEIYQQAGKMMDDFGLSGLEIHPYRK